VFAIFLLAAASFLARAQAFPPAEPILDYIAENRDDVAVLCYTAGESNPAFALNAQEPFPLASTYKLVVLAEMARQIDAGMIDPDEEIPLEAVNAYWLPGTDGGAHQAWLDTLAPDQDAVTLANVAYAMIAYSSNAAPDALLSKLGRDGFPELFDELGLENTDLPSGSYLGLYLAFDNHETGQVDPESLDRDSLLATRQHLENRYLADAEWREAELAYQQRKLDSLLDDPEAAAAELEKQAAYLAAFDNRGSARDMLTIMEAAFHGDVFAGAGQQFMQSILNWLMDVNPANRQVYDYLAAKGGSLPAILTGTWYVKPQGGEPLALAVFYRDLSPELWSEWVGTFAHQGLELRAVAGGEGCAVFEELAAVMPDSLDNELLR